MRKPVQILLGAAVLLSLLSLAACDFTIQHGVRKPKDLPPPFHVCEGAYASEAREGSSGFTWLTYYVDAEPNSVVDALLAAVPSEEWTPVELEWLNSWNRVEEYDELGDSKRVETYKAAYTHTDGRAFTFNVREPVPAAQGPPSLSVRMAIHPRQEAAAFVDGLHSYQRMLDEPLVFPDREAEPGS